MNRLLAVALVATLASACAADDFELRTRGAKDKDTSTTFSADDLLSPGGDTKSFAPDNTSCAAGLSVPTEVEPGVLQVIVDMKAIDGVRGWVGIYDAAKTAATSYVQWKPAPNGRSMIRFTGLAKGNYLLSPFCDYGYGARAAGHTAHVTLNPRAGNPCIAGKFLGANLTKGKATVRFVVPAATPQGAWIGVYKKDQRSNYAGTYKGYSYIKVRGQETSLDIALPANVDDPLEATIFCTGDYSQPTHTINL